MGSDALTSSIRGESLFYEDFRSFPLGIFPFDYSPLLEYHLLTPGYRGRWWEGTTVSRWKPKERWQITEENGEPALEQVTVLDQVAPQIVAGEEDWERYVLHVKLRPLSDQGWTGILFLYQHCLDFYALLAGEESVRLANFYNTQWQVLAEVPFVRDCDRRYAFTVDLTEGEIAAKVAFADDNSGVPVSLQARYEAGRRGKIGLLSENPARYYDVKVTAPQAIKKVWLQSRDKQQGDLDEARASYPKPVLTRVIDTHGFGAGKAVRFGDLTGEGVFHIVIAQNQPRVRGDSYDMISCLTAIDLDGRVLWQQGRPSPDQGLLTNDIPLQVYDIDGDGAAEVICAKDFRMLILDGRTGEVKNEAPTPRSRTLAKPFGWGSENAYYRTVGDSIAICNVRGRERPQDILIKNRYNDIWVYDASFNLLWTASCRTGHYPLAYDFNGDGRDEILVGYTLFSADGEVLWDLGLGDHADGLGVLPQEEGEPRIAIAAGDEGFLFTDFTGHVLRHDRMGHVQTVNAGNFRPDLPGLEFITITFWRYPGILSFYDAQGKLLYQKQPYPIGSHIKPVNWTGKGDELILFSASAHLPGLLDGFGRSVVNLPDDGHPDLACEAIDLFGDARDEIVAWDTNRIYIYTQATPFTGERIYAPHRPPHYNYSNYRCEISLPGWREFQS